MRRAFCQQIRDLSRTQKGGGDSPRGPSGLLDYGVLVGDDALCICDLLLCGRDDAVGSVFRERDDEGLLRLDGEDTADGGQGQEEVCDQLHGCGSGGVGGFDECGRPGVG